MAKAESKTILKVYSTVESKLPTLPLEDGQLIFVYDKKKIILDNRGVRTVYEQIQTIETEEQRNDLLAPIDSFYFVIETSILWRYTNGHWNQITTSPQEQIDRIVAEGTKQVKAVRDEGQKVLQSIPEDFQTQMETKLNKQQGIENKGKALVIGDDGLVIPGEVQSGGGDGIAIINTMSGESPLVIPDSAERTLERLELCGKTEQAQTTGANIFDQNLLLDFNSENYDKTQSSKGFYFYKFKVDGTVAVSTAKLNKNGEYLTVGIKPDGSGKTWLSHGSADISKYKTLTPEDGNIYLGVNNILERVENMLKNTGGIIINEGAAAKPYEPYTGGKPSPSPEYPQEIKSVGKWNEETRKYEVEVTINSSNLFKVTEHTTGYYTVKDGKVQFNKSIGYSWAVVVNNLHKQTVILHITTATNTRYRMYCTDLEDTILYKYEDSSANANDNSHTFNMPDGAKKIYVSVLEINSAEQAEIALNLGNTALPFEPYKEQTLTLTSDRPITKWDKLVEQGGQIGWLYAGVVIDRFDGQSNKISIANKQGNVQNFSIRFENVANGNGNADIFVDKYRAVQLSYTKAEYGICCNWNDGVKYFSAPNKNVATVDEFKAWLIENPLKIAYETTNPEFIPLPQSEQNAIRALKTYYPTTVITVDGGEVDPDIKATYTADTKNYIDNKFGKTINAMQTKLLELESRV